MTREGEGREGGEEGREGDLAEYARELREKYVETQGEKEKSEETTPIEQEELEGRAEAGKEEGMSDDFESYVRDLLQRYDAEQGEAQEERQVPELPVRHYGGAKTDSEAWVMHPPGEDDQWEDKMAKGSSDHIEGVTDAEEAREEGFDSKSVNAEISSNTESSTKSDGKDLTETNGGFEQDRQIDASESKLANRVREELDHLRERINERHNSLSEVTDRSEVPHNPTMGEPISERTTKLDARSSQPENPSDRGIHQERVRGEEKVATRSEFNAGSLPTREGKQRETPPQEGFLVAPRKGSETEASENHFIVSTLRGERSTNPRFFIAKRLIEDATGEKLERGKEYEVRGRIEGIGDFRMRHVERGESHMYVHVTKKSNRIK